MKRQLSNKNTYLEALVLTYLINVCIWLINYCSLTTNVLNTLCTPCISRLRMIRVEREIERDKERMNVPNSPCKAFLSDLVGLIRAVLNNMREREREIGQTDENCIPLFILGINKQIAYNFI